MSEKKKKSQKSFSSDKKEKKQQKDFDKKSGNMFCEMVPVVPSADTVLVIGGGASGLMAAIMAARGGAKVTILEQNERNGKKINATGNGKCNFTNSFWDETCIRGEHPEFADFALSAFDYKDTIAFFSDLGMVPAEKNGYYYPKSGQAASVSGLLTMEAAALGIKMKTCEHVCSIQKIQGSKETGKRENFWQILTEGWHYEASKVILACGSCASSIPGSDGSGYQLAESLGHTVIPPLPALTGLRLKDPARLFSKWTGVRYEGCVSVQVEERIAASSVGELQLTEYGVSGIPVFQISRYAIRSLAEGKKVQVVLDFVPELSEEALKTRIEERNKRYPFRKEQELFLGWLPDKLISALTELPDWKDSLKHLTFEVSAGMPFANAQAASGGVNTLEVNEKTMESKLQKGIYFCGELLDIDGTCGGYNLQWAWSSGALAGRCAAGKETL